jgi:hypothetical protein
MRLLVSREPVEENGLPEIVLIAVEIAGGVDDRVVVADEAADGVDDPVAVAAVVGTADRDTRSSSIRRPRVCSRGLFLLLSALTFSFPTLSADNAERMGHHHLRLVDDFLSGILVSHPFRKERG